MKRNLDPRTKLILLIFAAIYMSIQIPLHVEIAVIVIYLLPFVIAGLFKTSLIFGFLYFLQIIGHYYLLPSVHSAFLLFILSFLTIGVRQLFPSLLAGIYAIQTTDISEWIAAFKKLKTPRWLLISFSVIARFFPAIREDYQSIRQAMAFRGIGTNFWDLVKHPLQTFEYIFIPLLINATQVAEDLTISALTKGLGLPGQHTSLTQIKMTFYDYIFIGLTLLPLILYVGGLI